MTIQPTKRPWTSEDDAKLAELKAGGRTHLECARMLNRTPGAVQSHCQWLAQQARKAEDTPPDSVAPAPEQEVVADVAPTTVFANGRPWTPEEDGQLAELRRVGHEDEAIALLMGRTKAAVQARISNLRARGEGHDIPSRKRPSQWTPERIAEARALRTQGMTLHQIGRRFGTDAESVSRALRSPETTEDSPGEGVRVARTVPDHNRTAADVEAARAALARAEARHREALDPVLAIVREAILQAGYVDGPDGDDGDGVWPEPAWQVLNHLRRQGLEIRRVA